MACNQCSQNPNRPHICACAQQFGEKGRCCQSKPEICYSFQEIAKQTRLQWGENPLEEYLQAVINSSNMKLE